MSSQAANSENKGIYLYAIASKSENIDYNFKGILDNPIYGITVQQTTAVVSDAPIQRIRPERRHIAAHQGVIKYLMGKETVLPMSFGIIADNSTGIVKILSLNQEAFIQQLQNVAGSVEMGVIVSWDVPNIFEYFVATHSELLALRNRLFRSSHEPSREDKIELGRVFSSILDNDRKEYSDMVSDILSQHCKEIKFNPPRQEKEVLNISCLVERNAQDKFETAVFEAAQKFDNNFLFNYNGPWAPHNFVHVDLQL